MPSVTIGLGVLLILLGIGGYFGLGRVSITALIPTFFGLPLFILGLLAQKENLRKHAMHAAATLGLLGFLGSARGLPNFFILITGGDVARPKAVIMQSIMAILCVVFTGLCGKSFIDARRQREAAANQN